MSAGRGAGRGATVPGVSRPDPSVLARRLFFALWPCTRVRGELAARARACLAACGGRMTPRENLHVTLAFLGAVAPARTAEALRAGESVRGEPFDLAIDTLAWWPRRRLVYASPSGPPPALTDLAAALAHALAAGGFVLERRPYRAHVTLLRDVERGPEGVPAHRVAWRVRSYCLVESLRVARGVSYRPLRVWTLGGRPDMLASQREEC